MNDDLKKAIGERIKFVRGGLSREKFAQKIGSCRNSIMRYENGKASPSMELMARICTEFNILPNWLLLGEGPKYKGNEAEGNKKENNNIGYLEDPFITTIKKWLIKMISKNPDRMAWFRVEMLKHFPELEEYHEQEEAKKGASDSFEEGAAG